MHSLRLETPIGELQLVSDGECLTRLALEPCHRTLDQTTPDGVLVEASEQLRAYFAGHLECFELPLRPHGTPFQRRVWRELETLAYGRTSSYGELAARLNTSARAVGSANARNPIAIVIPCHRVVGSDGRLVGYAGGIGRKAWLLEHESRAGS